jgi:hypothetical protein
MKSISFTLVFTLITVFATQSFAVPGVSALGEWGRVMGQVADERGQGIANAEVGLGVFDERGNLIFVERTITNSGGRYYFDRVPFGRVVMKVEADGRSGIRRGFYLSDDVHVENFVL